MSEELLRRAASLMRRRAQATRELEGSQWYDIDGDDSDLDHMTAALDEWFHTNAARADAEHIITWSPAVALAVAGLLDAAADALPIDPGEPPRNPRDRRLVLAALDVAAVYIGKSS